MPGTLYLVAVPIGNPDDLSPRARDILRAAAVVAAEDTRHFATLARHHGLAHRARSATTITTRPNGRPGCSSAFAPGRTSRS